MRSRTELLHAAAWGIAAVSWTATIAVDAANLPGHVWGCCMTIAGISTLAAVQLAVSGRTDRIYVAMARAFITRPRDATGPQPKLVVSLDERRRRQPGRHASRRSAGA